MEWASYILGNELTDLGSSVKTEATMKIFIMIHLAVVILLPSSALAQAANVPMAQTCSNKRSVAKKSPWDRWQTPGRQPKGFCLPAC